MSHPDDGVAGRSFPSADVVVVTHRGPSATTACLESIERHRTSSLGSLVVVDNGTSQRRDDTLSYGSRDAALIHTPNNGYGAAVNAGVTALEDGDTPSETVIALNDDVVVTEGWIEALLAGFTSPTVGAVQPKMLLGDMSTIDSLGVDLDRYGAGRDIGHGEPDRPHPAGPIEIFTGGAVAFRRVFLHDLGGFDERFFLYYEDVDLALRGAEQGWTYRCQSNAVVAHVKGASTSALGTELRRLQERNRLWVAFRFGSPADVRRALWLSIRRLRHQPARAHVTALAQGLRAVPRVISARRRGRGAM